MSISAFCVIIFCIHTVDENDGFLFSTMSFLFLFSCENSSEKSMHFLSML